MTLVHAEVEKNIRNVAAAKRNVPKVFFLLFSGLSENLNIYNHLEIVSRVFSETSQRQARQWHLELIGRFFCRRRKIE